MAADHPDIDAYAVINPVRGEDAGVNYLLLRADNDETYAYQSIGPGAEMLRDMYKAAKDGRRYEDETGRLLRDLIKERRDAIRTVDVESVVGFDDDPFPLVTANIAADGLAGEERLETDAMIGTAIALFADAPLRIDPDLPGNAAVLEMNDEYFMDYAVDGHEFVSVDAAVPAPEPVVAEHDPGDYDRGTFEGYLGVDSIDTYVDQYMRNINMMQAQGADVTMLGNHGRDLEDVIEQELRNSIETFFRDFRHVDAGGQDYVVHGEFINEAVNKEYDRRNGGRDDVTGRELERINVYDRPTLVRDLLHTADDEHELYLDTAAPMVTDELVDLDGIDIAMPDLAVEAVPETLTVVRDGAPYEVDATFLPVLFPAPGTDTVHIAHSKDMVDDYDFDMDGFVQDHFQVGDPLPAEEDRTYL